ncbi:NAD-dependent dehydratase [Chania multitudinisentens RB-25]|uniref:NAD-dependent dehydratase n=1 Tax=Chania multitudinisentens RB-25 TaxID=1441930 RepID=W0L8L7_9GAMM|nr:SDR family oxidoreductase [Chania multitudinisentens]AHG18607.1 NAD-dependent dehydratase [Chania multitudinisentens RB-25]
MVNKTLNILIIGATGSIGKHVTAIAVNAGHRVRVLLRKTSHDEMLPEQVQKYYGDVTQPETLGDALKGIEAVVFTLGTHGQGKLGAQAVDYGGVRNVLMALRGRAVRVALMTTIGVTERKGVWNQRTQLHDWKRCSERLLRASGQVYTIVRPGWFDYNQPDEHRLILLQGDRRHSGTPQDGVIARKQIAEVLVASLTSQAAMNKSFELVAERGPAQHELEPLFAALKSDQHDALDGVEDLNNMPLAEEPVSVQMELQNLSALRNKP